MASCFFILRQFDDAIVYLKSIKNFYERDDDFNWNYGIAQASAGEFGEAEAAFQLVQNERYKADEVYLKWLGRCHVMSGNPGKAWELYLAMEGSADCLGLLQLIANDCYTMGHFYYAAKAFSTLMRLDPDRDYEEGFRGAVVGVLQMVIAEKDSPENLIEVLALLKTQSPTPQTEFVIKVIRGWGEENGLKIDEMI
jgi:intraflagellar transport protein 56